MNKRMLINRIIAFLMMLVMMVSVCPHVNIDVEAKSKAVEKDWGQIYFDFILDHQFDKYGVNKEDPYLYPTMTYELIFIDDDDIPEIVCCPAGDTGVILLYQSEGEVKYYQMPRKSSMRYIEREGIFEVEGLDWTTDNYWKRNSYYTHIHVLTNGVIGDRASGSFANKLTESGDYLDEYEYEWEKKTVSEEEYIKNCENIFVSKMASEYYSEGSILPYDCNGIILKILAKSMVYSDIAWIRAYQEFLVNCMYLEMGQDYGKEAEIVGKLYDIDHDGIPELILDNGYDGRALRSGYIYTYDNGVKFLDYGPSDAYVAYQNGYSGKLYGLYDEAAYEGYLWEYNKSNDIISSDLVIHFTNAADAIPIYRDYRYVEKSKVWILIKELSFYESLEKEKIDDRTGTVADLHDLLGQIGWYGETYDYRTITSGDIDPVFFLYVMNELRKYPGKIWERDSYDYNSRVADPKNLFNYAYYRLDGDGLDWVFKNIYNIDEKQIQELHKKEGEYIYYYNQDYYTIIRGVGGGYGAYLDDIEDLGGVYQITYHQITVPDGPTVLQYDRKYALMAYKKIDGVYYWSLYRVSDTPFTQEDADNIGVGFEINYHYKPYKIIALKAKSNGCYVTCDIGNRKDDGKGEYEHYDDPELHMDATGIGAYEMFELIPCSNGSYALRSVMNRKYLTKDVKYSAGRHSYVYKDFIDDTCQLTLDLNSTYTKIKFRNSGDYMCYGASIFRQLLEPGLDGSKAEEFEIVVLKEDEYEGWEKNILTSGEWYHLNGENGGYWDIQNEIGLVDGDNVRTLRRQGYSLMRLYGKGNGTIEVQNMQCAVGFKYIEGKYDVIVTFQGTSGYYGEKSWDNGWNIYKEIKNNVLDVLENIQGYSVVGCHGGYKSMADNLIAVEAVVTAKDEKTGKQITLKELINKAKKGEAKFTVLGHSMGGAIAQIYGLHLFNCGIPASQIRGRTFNSALAFTVDSIGDQFTDWINIGVSSDSVVNGNVIGSINKHGVHRLGKTIWLYDDEPEKGISKKANIDNSKHVMDKYEFGGEIKTGKLKTILDDVQNLNSYTYKGYQTIGDSDIFVTNKKNVPVYDRPKKDADPSYYIDGIHTVVEIESYTYNDVGNKWYKTKDGKFIYSGNLEVLKKQSIGWSMLPDFIIASDRAPLRAGCYNDTDVIERVKKDTAIDVDYAVKNGGGNVWYHATVNGNTGWIYSNHVQRGISEKKIVDSINWLLAIDCPVNISLYTSDDELAASIIDGEVYTADKKAINPYVIGDGKYFEVYDDEKYYVEIDSLSDGMMDYTIYRDYDAKAGEFKEIKKFEAVDLSEEQYFDSTIGGDIRAGDVELKVVDEDGNIIAEIEETQSAEGDEEQSIFDKKMLVIIAALAAAGLIAVIGIIAAVRKKRKKKEKISNE